MKIVIFVISIQLGYPSGLLGEDPSNLPENLFPYILQVANGKQKELNIYGNSGILKMAQELEIIYI